MLIATCAVLLTASASTPVGTGGALAFPVGVAEPGTIAVRVVDRNHLPLGGALVEGVFEGAGAAQLLFDERSDSAALVPLDEVTTGKDGRALLRAPAGGWCGVSVERSGFAAGRFLPLFAGYSYELVLDFGASVTVVCQNEDGSAVDAELWIEHRTFPKIPSGATPTRRVVTGPDGIAQVHHVPVGPTVIFARGENGARGRVDMQVGSAWRSNALFGDDVRVLTLHPTQERLIPLTDKAGVQIDGLRAILSFSDDLPRGWASVNMEDGGVRVSGILSEPPEFLDRLWRSVSVRVFGAGWRAVQFSALGGEPPSVWTEPVDLVRDVSAPPAPRSGRLWAKVDPFGFSHWESTRLDRDAVCKLDLSDKFGLAGALVEGGRIAAWLRAESTEAGIQLAWLEPASIRARLSVDGEAYHAGLVRFELANPALGDALPHGLSSPSWTFADPDGVCELQGLIPGRWRLSLSTSYLNTEGSDVYVDVGPGEQRQVDLSATRGIDLRGVVVDESGAALSGGVVTVVGLDRLSVSDGTFPVAEDGTFLISGLMPGAGYQVVWEEDPQVRSNLPQQFQGRLGLRTGRTAEVALTGEIPETLRIVVTSK